MAVRPVYHVLTEKPFYETVNVDFQFFSGFSLSQKQKSIESLHGSYAEIHPECRILEISSKSRSELGIALSAFNLKVEADRRTFSVECAFQSSKVFEGGGPYVDLLDKNSWDAKKDIRLHESGKLVEFQYFGIKFPLEPKDYFYNWLYVNALSMNREHAKKIVQYDSFSDIEFNPQKSINCQAKAAAIFVGLAKSRLLEEALLSRENFQKIVYGSDISDTYEQFTLNFDM